MKKTLTTIVALIVILVIVFILQSVFSKSVLESHIRNVLENAIKDENVEIDVSKCEQPSFNTDMLGWCFGSGRVFAMRDNNKELYNLVSRADYPTSGIRILNMRAEDAYFTIILHKDGIDHEYSQYQNIIESLSF